MTARNIYLIGIALAVFALPGLLPPQPASAAQGVRYTVTEIGTLGGARSAAFGLNNLGEVVGHSTTSGGQTHAFLRRKDGSLLDLGTLGGPDSHAYQINDSGSIIGRSQTADGRHHAFSSDIFGQMFDLSSLSPLLEGSFNTATGISDSVVVGYMDLTDLLDNGTVRGQNRSSHNARRKRVFLYNDQNKIVDLGTFGGDDAIATAVNKSGQITGYYTKGNHGGPFVAFLFSAGNVINLGRLGGYVPVPSGINDKGQVVGSVPTSSGETHAFLYDGGSLLDIGTRPGGGQSFAYQINNSGEAVGASDSAAGTIHAIIYSGGVMRDLNEFIPSQSGWVLSEARDINDAGQIVGTGLINGLQRAFLLTPVR